MSHVTGTVQTLASALTIGPDSGQPATSPNTWAHDFAHTPAPTGTKFVILHFSGVQLPAGNRLEVDLGYDTDVYTAAAGSHFWTRPIDLTAFANGLVPIRYVASGAASGKVDLDRYGRGERHPGHQDPTSESNSDPFFVETPYAEPDYDQAWYCTSAPPNPRWDNIRCVNQANDVRRSVALSVGMLVTVHTDDPNHAPHISTCTGTLIEPGLFISAGHCFNSNDEALSSFVTFDYETRCNGTVEPNHNARFHRVTGIVRRHWNFAATPPYDYVLLELEPATGGLGATPLPIRQGLPAVGEEVFGIHHPNGAVKKISPRAGQAATVVSASANEIEVSLDVSGGSSGSGLFDLQGRYLGVLSAGGPCSLRYFPIGSVNEDVATPQVTRDVMIVFDRSGSMSMDAGTGSTKIEEARDAASLFVQLVRSAAGNRMGLVSFSTTASAPVDFPLASFEPGARDDLVGASSPYSAGVVGALLPGGATTIGGGLQAAQQQFPTPGANPRAILLLTDGLQNMPPMISTVEPSLAGIDLHAIGYGTPASLDGALLTQLTQSHGGHYTQATDPLQLRKFFVMAFGQMFEAGALVDPEYTLKAGDGHADPMPFSVCGEETVTVTLGWQPAGPRLELAVTTPSGRRVDPSAAGVDADHGRAWAFVRIPLPYEGERDGEWHVHVSRVPDREAERAAPEVRYFVAVVAGGGPELRHVPQARRYFTGDAINPLAVLRHRDSSIPHGAKVALTVHRPQSAVGDLLAREKLHEPATLDGDTIAARHSTLLALEQTGEGALAGRTALEFELSDLHADTGHFAHGGVFGRHLDDLLTVEGDYTFHLRATYGHGCTGAREHVWTLHVDVGIDGDASDLDVDRGPDGRVTLTITPRDRFGHLLGPGRAADLGLAGAAGTSLDLPASDNGDGTYTVTGTFDPGAGVEPGLIVQQPGGPPIVIGSTGTSVGRDCRWWQLLALLLAVLVIVLLVVLVA